MSSTDQTLPPDPEGDSPLFSEDEPRCVVDDSGIEITFEDEAWENVTDGTGVFAAVNAAFDQVARAPISLGILLTNDAHMAELNQQFRDKTGPTNVLSFPFDDVLDDAAYLGDIAIAYGTVCREAEEAGIEVSERLAHMVVHGVLHLLGHDHIEDKEAEIMEALEVKALAGLGYANPYTDGPAG